MKIYSITEAFSMQPTTYYVGGTFFIGENRTTPVKVARIELEQRQVTSELLVDMYVGYDKDGKVLFESLRSSVNVTYF
jgi:hypothetical protein